MTITADGSCPERHERRILCQGASWLEPVAGVGKPAYTYNFGLKEFTELERAARSGKSSIKPTSRTTETAAVRRNGHAYINDKKVGSGRVENTRLTFSPTTPPTWADEGTNVAPTKSTTTSSLEKSWQVCRRYELARRWSPRYGLASE